MMTLKKQISWGIRAQIVLGGVFAVMCGAFYFLGYRPMTTKIASLDREIASMQQELADNSVRSKILPDVAKDVSRLRLKLDGAKKLPKEMDVAGFITDITRISQRTQLRKPDYHPEEPKRGELFSIYPIRLSLSGDFNDVFTFIRETESLPRLSRVRSINIKRGEKDGSTVIVNMGMDLYFSPDM